MICSRVTVILVAAWSVAGVDSAFTMRVCCAGSESGGAVWHPLTLAKRAVVRRAVRVFFMDIILENEKAGRLFVRANLQRPAMHFSPYSVIVRVRIYFSLAYIRVSAL